MTRRRRPRARRIVRVSRVVSDLGRAEGFYRDALGFFAVARGPCDRAILAALGVGDQADEVVMRLGTSDVALVRFAVPGRPYPRNSRGDDLWFQHLAIVVGDMDAAYAHLSSCPGWSPISDGGPQLLPPSNGAVRAFKFRDPDGHPLELIWFPPGHGRAVWHESASPTFQGIDHSAMSVASTSRSLAFYRALGLRVCDRSVNCGPAQDRLDGLAAVRVRVTSVRPVLAAGPGLELLGYHPPGRAAGTLRPNDITTDWVTLAIGPMPSAPGARAVRDPDGHLLILTSQGSGPIGLPA